MIRRKGICQYGAFVIFPFRICWRGVHASRKSTQNLELRVDPRVDPIGRNLTTFLSGNPCQPGSLARRCLKTLPSNGRQFLSDDIKSRGIGIFGLAGQLLGDRFERLRVKQADGFGKRAE